MTQLPTKTKTPDEFYFAGFKSLNSTPIPDEFFDVLAVRLSEAELRVLLYIMRRTFGFKKTADAISLNQLTDGIRRRDGSLLDSGTGLSRPSVLKAVAGLQTKGIIAVEKRTGSDGRNEVNVYSLRFQGNNDNSLPKAGLPQLQNYSNSKYSGNEQNFSLTPDPQFVSAPSSDFASQSGMTMEQRRSGVKPVYYRGKASLPGGVTNHTRVGQPEETQRVKMLNPQHGSLQILREQPTVQQPVLRSVGSLALQVPDELEPVEVEVDGDLLYINFRKLVVALVELGLSEKTATALAYDYPEAYLWEKVELTRRQAARSSHQCTVRNTAGYLRRAIEEDYQLPTTNRPARPQFPYTAALVDNHAEGNRAEDDASTDGGNRVGDNRAQDDPPTRIDNWQPATDNFPNDQPLASNTFSGNQLLATDNSTQYTAPLPPIHRASGSDLATPVTLNDSYPVGPARAAQPSGGAKGGRETCYAELWEQIKEDLAGRFRLERLLPLLEGAWLWLEETEPQAVVILAAEWQARQLAMSDRSAIGLAVRQRLGPGYDLCFRVGTG